jgi:hypothetical protein
VEGAQTRHLGLYAVGEHPGNRPGPIRLHPFVTPTGAEGGSRCSGGRGRDYSPPSNHNLSNGLGLDIQLIVCALPCSLYSRKMPPEKEAAMLKQACAIRLIAATARAQTAVPALLPRQSGPKAVQRIAIYRTYWHLRRGTAEEVLLVIRPEDPAEVALSSLHLEVPSTGGLTVTRYPVSKSP